MARPVIGICGALEQARWGNWDRLVVLSPRNYSLTVQAAGAVAVVLPPDESWLDDPTDVLDVIDGLLLSGGSDVDPRSYGAEPHPATTGFRVERDRSELALARGAIERGVPVLGVCRGMQILNIALGGTLIQDIDNLDIHRRTRGEFHRHEVRLEPGSLAARAAGSERLSVQSHHHQGVDVLGAGLEVSGWAVEDGLIEAIEVPEGAFALGVLWHPEEDRGTGLFSAFTAAAAERQPA
jgi:putative glutamine amidotransferase